jgi:hypothetical protein
MIEGNKETMNVVMIEYTTSEASNERLEQGIGLIELWKD